MSEERSPTLSTTRLVGGSLWVLIFSVCFFSASLQYNPNFKTRWDFWSAVPWYLLDLLPGGGADSDIPSGWSHFSPRLVLIIYATFIAAAGWSLGQLVLRALKLTEAITGLERHVLAAAVGYALLSLTTLGLGLAGFLSTTLFRIGLVIPVLFEVGLRLKHRKLATNDQKADDREPWVLPFGVLALSITMAIFLACMLFGALLPSIDFDVKEYHLQGPKEWFQAGQITFLEHNVYTSFPFLTEMLSLTGMVVAGNWFSGALVGKAVLMTFAPLTALALCCLGRRWFSARVGWWAALIYLTTPWVYRVSIIAYTEGALMCYLTVTLLAFDFARSHLQTEKLAKPLWLVTGFLAGSAMACKYPGLISVVLPVSVAALVVCWQQKTNPLPAKRVLTYAIFFVVGGVLAIGPWLVKNCVHTGNPVYPLAWSVFGGDDWSQELQSKWQDAHSPPHHNLADVPVKLWEVVARSDYQSLLLFAFAPLAFLWKENRKAVLYLWCLTGWLFLSWWVLTHRIDRFWLPLIPPTCLLAAVGVERLWQSRAKWLVGGVMAASILFNLGMIVSVWAGLNMYLADLEQLSASAVIQPPGIRYLNESMATERMSSDIKLLSVGEANVFDARFPVAYNTVFDQSLLEQWCATRISGSSPPAWEWLSAEEIKANFRQAGVTHVLVNWSEILRYRMTYRYTDFVLPDSLDRLVELGILSTPQQLTFKPLADMSDSERAEVEQNLGGRVEDVQRKPALITNEVYRVPAE